MAASYPAGFDTMSDPAANLSGPPLHSTMHNQINDVLEAIEAELGLNPSGAAATVAAVTATTAWTAVTFTNGWVDFGAGFQTARYRKVGDIVYIEARIKSGTMTATAFTLPVGFRPLLGQQFIATSNGGTTLAMVQILATGTVAPAVGSNVDFAFNVSFSVSS